MNIPTLQAPLTHSNKKAIFGSKDIDNYFVNAIKKQQDINFKNYLKTKAK